MTNFLKPTPLALAFWISLVCIVLLAGCQSYQPPGGDLWQAVEAGR